MHFVIDIKNYSEGNILLYINFRHLYMLTSVYNSVMMNCAQFFPFTLK